MKKNLLTAFAGLAAALLYVSSAQAATIPTLSLSLQESGFAAQTASSTTGTVAMSGAYDDFMINYISGVGAPSLSSPLLDLTTVNVSASSLSSSHTLTIELTETGLTATTGALPLASAFTAILGLGVTSANVASYYDPSNTAYGTADLLGSAMFPSMSNSVTVNGSENIPNLSNPFSETEIITATFAPGAGDTLNGSAYIEANSAAPEPASCALIGAGLLGVALIRRRRSSN